MKGVVVGVILCGFCLSYGSDAINIDIGSAGFKGLLRLEDVIQRRLSQPAIIRNFLTNLMLNGGKGGTGRQSPFAKGVADLAASIKGLFSAAINIVTGNTKAVGQMILRGWRMVNQVIASTIRGIMRVAVDVIIGRQSANSKKNAGKVLGAVKGLLGKFKPLKGLKNLFKNLPHPLAKFGSVFNGQRLKNMVSSLIDFLKSRLQNVVNDAINRGKQRIRDIPKNMLDAISKLGSGIKKRPKLAAALASHVVDALKKARETFKKGAVKALGLTFHMFGRIVRDVINAVRRIGDRLKSGLSKTVRALSGVLGKLGGRLKQRGPLRKLIGFIISSVGNWIKLVTDLITGFAKSIENINTTIQKTIQNLVLGALDALWGVVQTVIISRRVVKNNGLLKAILALFPKPGHGMHMLSNLVKGGRARRMERHKKLTDALKNLAKSASAKRPKPVQKLLSNLGKFLSKHPLRNAFNVSVSIGKNLASLMSGAVKIIIQLVVRSSLGGSFLAKIVSRLFGGGQNKSSLLARLTAGVNTATSILHKLTGLGGGFKFLSGIISAILYILGPFFKNRGGGGILQ